MHTTYMYVVRCVWIMYCEEHKYSTHVLCMNEVVTEVGAPHTSLDDHSLTFPWAAFVKASISTDWFCIHLLYTTSSNYGHKYIHKCMC